MITSDELTAGILPPPTASPALAAAQLRIADSAMALAERLLAEVPTGRARDAAARHLMRTVQAAYTAMQPPLRPTTTATPAEAATPPTAAAEPHPVPLVPLVPDAELWRFGVLHSSLPALSRLVAFAIAECADPTGHIPDEQQPTLTQLAERVDLPMGHLHICLGDLVTNGWLNRHRVRDQDIKVTRYQLRLPAPRRRD